MPEKTSSSEPFPLLNTSADQLHSAQTDNAARQRRRKSSSLGGDPRGDTGAPGLATSLAHLGAAHGHSHDSKDSLGASASGSKRFSKRRKTRSLMRKAKRFALKHTWVLPLVILFVFFSLYAINPSESNPVHRFIFLSYELPVPAGSAPDTASQYGKGPWDIAFVSFYTVVLSFTREFIMQELLRPLARYAGLKSRGKQARFMEQMYTAIYFAFLGPAGMFVMSRTPVWYYNTAGMYEGFPHRTHEAYFKFYYLFQAAYWAQQAIVLVLGMEKPRKDFKELILHHIVSLALIGLSYRFHFTYMGLAVYITHDISDFFLATSKCLNYIDHWITPPYFALFASVWIYLRHYINLRIIWSLFTEFKTVGPYELNWETEQYKCWISFIITLSLLVSLQTLNLIWLFYIIRIAYRMVFMNIQEDDRSDADDTEEEEEQVDPTATEKAPLLQEKEAATNGHAVLNGAAKEAAAVNGKAKTANGSARKR